MTIQMCRAVRVKAPAMRIAGGPLTRLVYLQYYSLTSQTLEALTPSCGGESDHHPVHNSYLHCQQISADESIMRWLSIEHMLLSHLTV